MTETGSGADLLNQLAHEFAERFRKGERPALSEYTDNHPDLAADIRELFPALLVMEQFGQPSGGDPRMLGAESPMPAQLGEYRILREVARGGMGIVYEAVQEPLGRHVALKVLPFHSVATGNHLERFQREARAAANLHHTNIVPVFGVGEHQGLHFYAMQFIQGQSLDNVLRELRRLRHIKRHASDDSKKTEPAGRDISEADLSFSLAAGLLSGRFEVAAEKESKPVEEPARADQCNDRLRAASSKSNIAPSTNTGTFSDSAFTLHQSSLSSQTDQQYFRGVARLGVQVAEALAYAHSQGVLHRDIKPSNLLLDTQGTVWITDFGLAKASDSDDLTATGDILGTLRYMAPERFQGQADIRGDVYGLGVTLYEMLTLRPVFADTIRAQLVERILSDDPPRPRKLDSRIPRDLETIVLKAIAKEPKKRYPHAAELGADLKRFAEDRPIRARQVGARERVWRWCRRNPALATMAGMLGLMLVAITVVSAIGYARTNQALNREAEQRGIAELEAARNRSLAYTADMRSAAQLWENEPTSGSFVADLLQAYVPIPGTDEDLREFTWYYQNRLLHNAREFPVDNPVQGICLTDNDHSVVIEAHDIRSRDLVTGKIAWQRPLPSENVKWVTDFSSDGSLMALATEDGRITLIRTGTGQESTFLQGAGSIKDISFAVGGQALAIMDPEGQVRVRDISSGTVLRTFQVANPGQFWMLSPDGMTLVMAPSPNHNELSIYRFRQEGPQIVHGRDLTISAIAFSPNGRMIASGDICIDLWDAITGDRIDSIPLLGSYVSALAFSPNNKQLCAGTGDGLLTVWNVATRKLLYRLKGHTAKIRSVASSPDRGTLASTSADGTVRIWNLPQAPEYQILTKEAGQDRVAYSPDGRWVAAGGPSTQVWDARTYRLARRLPPSCGVAFSPDGKTLATGGADSLVRLWDPFSGHSLLTLSGRPEEPDSNRRAISALAFSPDGRFLAAGFGYLNWFQPNYSQVVKVWEVHSGKLIAELPHPNAVPALQFSPDGRTLATACHDHRVRLWSVDLCEERQHWEGASEFTALAFVPGKNLLVTGNGDGVLQLWEADTGGPLGTLGRHGHRVMNLAPSLDGKTLASAAVDQTVKLWSLVSERELRTLHGHSSPVSGVAFAPDGKALVSIGDDRTVRLWDTLTPWLRLEHARTALLEDIASHPNWAEAHYELARTHRQLGEYDAALAELSKTIDLDPNFAPALKDRALGYVRKCQWDQAAADFNQLVKFEADEPWHWYQLATLNLYLGRLQDYRLTCREMLARFGDGEVAEERVAKTCLLAPEALPDLTRAFQLADRAVTAYERNPDYRWFVLTKALAEYRAGHYASAEDWIKRFKPLIDGAHYDASAFAILAMTLHQISRDPSARRQSSEAGESTTVRENSSTKAATTPSQPKTPSSGAPPFGDIPGLFRVAVIQYPIPRDAQTALQYAQDILSRKMPNPKTGPSWGSRFPLRVGDFHDWLHASILTREAERLLPTEKKKQMP
jgi:WD40 repeat protein/serine/threonine protein kinase